MTINQRKYRRFTRARFITMATALASVRASIPGVNVRGDFRDWRSIAAFGVQVGEGATKRRTEFSFNTGPGWLGSIMPRVSVDMTTRKIRAWLDETQ